MAMQLHCWDLHRTWVLLPGEVASGFVERGEYFFASPFPGAHLCIDEEYLLQATEDGQAGWRWCPGFYAGVVMAELLDEQGKTLAEFKLDVAPDDRKLGADVYAEYVNELLAFDPRLLFGTESAQAAAGVGGDYTSLHLRYARLRRYGPSLVRRFTQVLRQPLARLGMRRALKPAREARRFDHQTILHMRNRPHLAVMAKEGPQSCDGNSRFDVPQPYETLDNPANRALGATLEAVMRRVKEVTAELNALTDSSSRSETRTALSPKIQRRLGFLQELTAGLRRVQRSPLFSQLGRIEITAAGLNAIAAHPIYASAFRMGWFALRNGVDDSQLDELLWLCPTWEIYERWCFLKVIQALQLAYAGLNWAISCPGSTIDCIQCLGTGPGVEVTAWLQLTYPAGDMRPNRWGFGSISAQRRPDITILRESGDQGCFIVLDAKYRVAREHVLEGMSSAHLYRDSLRWKGLPPRASLLLVPKGSGVPWLQWENALELHGIGVHQLSAAEDVSRLAALLKTVLGV
jgi:hypothetical protein